MALAANNVIVSNDYNRELIRLCGYRSYPGNGTSYDNYLEKVRGVSHDIDDLIVGNASIDLVHAGSLATPFTNPDNIKQIGHVTLEAGDYEESIFIGFGYDFRVKGASVSLSLRDRLGILLEKEIGSDEQPIRTDSEFVDENNTIPSYVYNLSNPADLVWALLVYYGDFYDDPDDGNPYIDYTSWLAWKEACTTLQYSLGLCIKGMSIHDIIKKIAEITGSVIFGNNWGKLEFYRYLTTDEVTVSGIYTASELVDVNMGVEDEPLINSYTMWYGYDPDTDTWTGSTNKVDDASIALYGLHSEVEQDDAVFHSTAISAENQAQAIVDVYKNPRQTVDITVPLGGSIIKAGNIIQVTEPFYSLATAGFRVVNVSKDIVGGKIKIKGRDYSIEATGWMWENVTPMDVDPLYTSQGWHKASSDVGPSLLNWVTWPFARINPGYGTIEGESWDWRDYTHDWDVANYAANPSLYSHHFSLCPYTSDFMSCRSKDVVSFTIDGAMSFLAYYPTVYTHEGERRLTNLQSTTKVEPSPSNDEISFDSSIQRYSISTTPYTPDMVQSLLIFTVYEYDETYALLRTTPAKVLLCSHGYLIDLTLGWPISREQFYTDKMWTAGRVVEHFSYWGDCVQNWFKKYFTTNCSVTLATLTAHIKYKVDMVWNGLNPGRPFLYPNGPANNYWESVYGPRPHISIIEYNPSPGTIATAGYIDLRAPDYYYTPNETAAMASNATGNTVEMRVNVIDADADNPFYFQIADGTRKTTVVLTSPTNGYKQLMLTLKDTEGCYYINGILSTANATATCSSNGMKFGFEGATGMGEAYVDYVRWTTGAVWDPGSDPVPAVGVYSGTTGGSNTLPSPTNLALAEGYRLDSAGNYIPTVTITFSEPSSLGCLFPIYHKYASEATYTYIGEATTSGYVVDAPVGLNYYRVLTRKGSSYSNSAIAPTKGISVVGQDPDEVEAEASEEVNYDVVDTVLTAHFANNLLTDQGHTISETSGVTFTVEGFTGAAASFASGNYLVYDHELGDRGSLFLRASLATDLSNLSRRIYLFANEAPELSLFICPTDQKIKLSAYGQEVYEYDLTGWSEDSYKLIGIVWDFVNKMFYLNVDGEEGDAID